MNCIIPFKSKVKFDYPVKEICSISLEHEITKNVNELLGNFFISGTCKKHELSVNTTDFKFIIPFSVEYTNKIDIDTLEFSIDNFTYELDNNELSVNIDYMLSADDFEELSQDDELDPYELIQDEPFKEESSEEIREKAPKEENNINEKENYQDVISNINMDNDYIMYHVHLIKQDDTIESICKTYKVEKDDILKINNISSLEEIDKLLIPLQDE